MVYTPYEIKIKEKSYLTIIATIQRHAVIPEMLEKMRQYFLLDILRFHAVSTAALFDYLKKQN